MILDRRTTAHCAVCVLLLVVGGCGSSTAAGMTTCSEYRALDLPLEQQLQMVENEDQRAMLKEMLRSYGKDTGRMNVTAADLQIRIFCGVDNSSGRYSNPDVAIQDAFDWSG